MSHSQAIVSEFTHQSEAFNVSPVMSSTETLQRLIEFLPRAADAFWLEAACGPAIVGRALASLVGRVLGIDLTPAMIAIARREAERAGLTNTSVAVGEATPNPRRAEATRLRRFAPAELRDATGGRSYG